MSIEEFGIFVVVFAVIGTMLSFLLLTYGIFLKMKNDYGKKDSFWKGDLNWI